VIQLLFFFFVGGDAHINPLVTLCILKRKKKEKLPSPIEVKAVTDMN